jgi:hypothetical protein
MLALTFLAGSIIVGVDLTKRLFPFTSRPERFFWGVVLGPMASIWTAYIASRILGHLSYVMLVILAIVIWAMVGLFVYEKWPGFKKPTIRVELIKKSKLQIILALIFATIFAFFFYKGMFHPTVDGMFLTATTWYDLAYHLALATSFLYGQNFPPVNPVFPIEPLRYHFMGDFHAAMLLKLGLGIWPAFGITSLIMALALVGIFYCFARRLTESDVASFIATLLFFFSGGLGFVLFFGDWRDSGQPFFKFFWNMKENYTDMWSRGIKWTNLMTSGVIPQRSMLYGMPIAIILLTLIAVVWKRWNIEKHHGAWQGIEVLFPAGVIAGLLPLFHYHAYAVVVFTSCILFLIKPRRVWLAFWLPAALIALPQWRDFGSHIATGPPLRFHLGWVSYTYSNFFLFMIRNFGLPLILIFPAFFFAPRYLRTFYVPFAALMVLCFMFLISKDDVDNTKLLFYWHAGTAVVIAAWLARWARRPVGTAVVVIAVVACTLSGVLSVIRESKVAWRIFSPSEIAAGAFASSLPPKSLFLSGPTHSQPALCLAGKPIVLGFEFLITSQGYSRAKYNAILGDIKRIYSGDAKTQALIAKYHVNYVYVGSYERDKLNANTSYFDQHYKAVFRNSDIVIYDAASLRGASNRSLPTAGRHWNFTFLDSFDSWPPLASYEATSLAL